MPRLVQHGGSGQSYMAEQMTIIQAAPGQAPPPPSAERVSDRATLDSSPELTRVWNIPAPVRSFTGREQQVADLHELLVRKRTAALVPAGAVAALHGMGGIGKTQLARAYAHHYGGQYEVGWWVPADSDVAIVAALGELGRRLGLATDLTPAGLLAEIQSVLAARSPWLLVFDNADDPAIVEPFLQELDPHSRGHVLVTSRNPGWEGLADPIAVDVLPHKQAAALLLRRSGDKSDDAHAAAWELAGELGCLPLALEQAAAYAAQYRVPLAQYLVTFQKQQAALLAEGRPLAYQGTVDVTFTLAVERLAAVNPAAVPLLELCACLAPEQIPARLILTKPALLPDPLGQAADPMNQNRVLGPLFWTGLVTADWKTPFECIGSSRPLLRITWPSLPGGLV